MNVSIIGAGSMGCAMAVLLTKNGHKVKMWTRFEDEVAMINSSREHLYKLPGVIIPESVVCTADLEQGISNAEVIVIALPSQTVRQNAREISRIVKDRDLIIVNCSKGIEEETCLLMSQLLREEIPCARVATLSGPSHAEEIARSIPTAIVAASEDMQTASFVQDLFMSQSFRVYTNTDIVGVELGGAVKNIIALCAGISDGLGFGDNTKAALMTRGIAEISRLGVAMGARFQTFTGLTGIGDLIVTCTSMHSRNRRAGILIGQGKSVEQALAEINMAVEGVSTVRPTCKLARKMNVAMPITYEAYEILFNGKNPMDAVVDLMTRDRKEEITFD